MAEFWKTVASTFLASIKSVGTACTLASVGIYLHQRGFVVGNGKRTLALISQQVTIPLLFFTKILYCNQDWSPDPCPNVTSSLRDVWILLVWPLWVCTAGMVVGYAVTIVAKVPSHQKQSIMAAVAFGNSTGLPITLLTVIHSNFGASSALGSVDPTLFLSVYLVLYPVLQWGIGGVLLATPTTNLPPKANGLSPEIHEPNHYPSSDTTGEHHHHHEFVPLQHQLSFKSTIKKSIADEIDKTRKTLARNVINRNAKMPENYQITHRGLDSTDASMYWSVQENLNRWGKPLYGMAPVGSGVFQLEPTLEEGTTPIYPPRTYSGANIGMDISANESIPEDTTIMPVETDALLEIPRPILSESSSRSSSSNSSQDDNKEPLMDTAKTIVKRCFQPPVIAALLGLLFASFPEIRGILVDIDDRDGSAPLQWFFDGLYEVGRAAVPINMIILGCNLSASYMLEYGRSGNNPTETAKTHFSTKASLLVVVGKMIVMPMVGVLSTFALERYYVVPPEIAGSLYLVLLIVFLCPTANNVMVMVELSGSGGSKESMARVIAYEYAVAPLVLSLTVTIAVLVASYMGREANGL